MYINSYFIEWNQFLNEFIKNFKILKYDKKVFN